ncbi:MAG: hypothetical protein RL653_3357, partial [Pseudomonadota bacterium]
SGEVCTGGTCQASCLAGQVPCGGKCVDPATDRTFCGAQGDCAGPNDGVACSAWEFCSAGACINNDATLSGLVVSPGSLSPGFAPSTFLYVVSAMGYVDSVVVTPTAAAGVAGANITVNGTPVLSGSPSAPIPLGSGSLTSITVRVVTPNGAERNYGIVVVRGNPETAYLKASNTGTGDQFGYSLALDGNTLAVGAAYEDSRAAGVNPTLAPDGSDAQSNDGATRSGAVYVFTRLNGAWTQQAYLKASDSEPQDQFGFSVALSGDTLAVGARREDSSATGINGTEVDYGAANSGAVYVFTRSNGVWSQEAYVKASNSGAADEFGFSLSLEGNTLVVGALFEDSSATGVNPTLTPDGADAQSDASASNSGAVYVFNRTNGVWTQEAYVKAANPGLDDMFGHSVALSGDTMVVGAPGEASAVAGINGDPSDNSAPEAGAVYVFTRSNGTWTQQAYIKASNPGTTDQFGYVVALDGHTLAVGAPYESSNATGVNPGAAAEADDSALYSGAVYVFTRTGQAWTQQAYVKASNANGNDKFGTSVALHDNILAVGASYESSSATGINGNEADNSSSTSGAVYVFTRTSGNWTQRWYLKATNTGSGDFFGETVALSEDMLVVGATWEDSSATGVTGDQADNSMTDSGAVFVYTPPRN